MANRDTIGVAACPHCGALQELRVNKGRRVYLKCFGTVEGLACGFECAWPGAESAKTIAAAAKDGWLGPIPYGYFPPTSEQGNSYAHVLDKITDHETRRETGPYVINVIERGKRQPAAAPQPEPTPRAEPEPAPAAGTQPRRPFRFGGR